MRNKLFDSLDLLQKEKIFTGWEKIDDVYCKFSLHNVNIPLIVTFSSAKIPIPINKLDDPTCSPWGFDFVSKSGFNVISFSCIEKDNWYRSDVFLKFIKQLGDKLRKFNSRLGYGESMGGYGVSAYANLLNLQRVLILNPISTLKSDLIPWESRFHSEKKLNWDSGCFDGARMLSSGYIVYDPLHNLDKAHALRYSNDLIPLRLPAVGHGIPYHLKRLGILKKLFFDFVYDCVDLSWFYRKIRGRKIYHHYYKTLSTHRRITPLRKEVLDRHYRCFKEWSDHTDIPVNDLRDAAISIEKINIKLALELMEKALRARPEGDFIRAKVLEYRKMLPGYNT
ncbi:hypothetical protein [Endozoicomonas euniceicola]|uniref:Cytosolic protein n=1 Tax=Endozoicomonas euniceicola TaxID=1234143 RepID=A0ABY6H136_9GAMM|nr:hypothetical protein [Endozoicomonas euniceicola]UYM18512.1 hypothetical protein NX720_11615 [Endozoicomonas euniceicola]